jgi:hypothetical protein
MSSTHRFTEYPLPKYANLNARLSTCCLAETAALAHARTSSQPAEHATIAVTLERNL